MTPPLHLDLYTRTVLGVIGLCLVILVMRTATPADAHAQSAMRCTGTLTANSFGADAPLTGGYEVDVRCR
jgi:hypothetical protein